MRKQVGLKQMQLIDDLVSHFNKSKAQFSVLIDSLSSNIEHSDSIKKLIHSTKSRIKDSEHLKDKLIRKSKDAIESNQPFSYTKENLFLKINDLAGFRILHLHTKQFQKIDIE